MFRSVKYEDMHLRQDDGHEGQVICSVWSSKIRGRICFDSHVLTCVLGIPAFGCATRTIDSIGGREVPAVY
jgi:hypothetical protein